MGFLTGKPFFFCIFPSYVKTAPCEVLKKVENYKTYIKMFKSHQLKKAREEMELVRNTVTENMKNLI